jgi:hypothetical protein
VTTRSAPEEKEARRAVSLMDGPMFAHKRAASRRQRGWRQAERPLARAAGSLLPARSPLPLALAQPPAEYSLIRVHLKEVIAAPD